MKKNISTLLSIFWACILQAQQSPIMVCNGNGTICTPYYSLNEAVHMANANEFIYLPGGTFQLDSTIDKPLNIIGAGCRQDSSATTGITTINGNLIISKNASSSLFEGFFLNGVMNTPDTLRDCLFRRMNSGGFAITGYIEACLIEHCILRESSSMNGSGCWITNSIVRTIHGLQNSTIQHTIFFGDVGYTSWGGYWATFNGCNSTSFSHCIFMHAIGWPNGSNSNMCMANNVYLGGSHGGFSFTCDYNNYTANSLADVFQNPVQVTDIYNINESALQVIPSLPMGYNTVRGIYGGDSPWKPGMVPSNPHIFFKQVSSNTNQNGDLPVLIKVRTEN